MTTCPLCYGDGYVVDESDPINAIAEQCPMCGGSGQIEIKEIDKE